MFFFFSNISTSVKLCQSTKRFQVETPQICEKNFKNILVVSYAKIITEFVSVVSFYFLPIYL